MGDDCKLQASHAFQGRSLRLLLRRFSKCAVFAGMCVFYIVPRGAAAQTQPIHTQPNANPQLFLRMGHSSLVQGLEFSPDGRYLASVDTYGNAFVWDIRAQTTLKYFKTISTLTAHHLPKMTALGILSSERDGIHLYSWPPTTSLLIHPVLRDHFAAVLGASADGSIFIYQDDSKIKVRRIKSPTDEARTVLSIDSTDEGTFDAACVSDGRKCVIWTDDGRVWLLNNPLSGGITSKTFPRLEVDSVAFTGSDVLIEGEQSPPPSKNKETADEESYVIRVINFDTQQDVLKVPDDIGNAKLTTDGNYLFYSEGTIIFKSPLSGWSPTQIFKTDIIPDLIQSFAVNADGKALAYANAANELATVDLTAEASGNSAKLSGPLEPIGRLHPDPTAPAFFASSLASISAWNMESGFQSFRRYARGGIAAIAGDGKTLAYFDLNGLVLMDLSSGQSHAQDLILEGKKVKSAAALALSPDGQKLWWASPPLFRSDLYSRDISTLSSDGIKHCKLTRPSSPLFEHSVDGMLLVTQCAETGDTQDKGDNALYLWQLQSGQVTKTIPFPEICYAAAISWDDQRLAVATLNKLVLIDLTSGNKQVIQLPPGKRYDSLAFAKDADRLIAGSSSFLSDSGYIDIWSLSTGTHNEVGGHSAGVTSVMTSRRGWIFSSSEDGTIIMHDKISGKPIATIIPAGDYGWLAVTPDGLFDGTPEAMQFAGWRANAKSQVVTLDAFFDDFFRPGILSDLLEGVPVAPPRISLSSILNVPGINYLVEEKLARVAEINGKSYLCLSSKPDDALLSDIGVSLKSAPNSLKAADFSEGPGQSCAYVKELKGSWRDYEVFSTKKSTVSLSGAKWDGTRPSLSSATVHIQTVAEQAYSLYPALQTLKTPISDAGAISTELTKNIGGFAKVWPPLVDANLLSIKVQLAELAETSKPEDVIILFFSGHGTVPVGDPMFYFLTADDSPSSRQPTGFNTAMLAEFIRMARAQRIVIIIDACQAGGSLDSLNKVIETKERIWERQKTLNGELAKLPFSVVIVAAATPLQSAVEKKVGHGLLTQGILDGFAAGKLSIRQLTDYLPGRLEELSADLPYKQTPLILSLGSDIPLTISSTASKEH
jgi:WD40 repeat protein